MIILGFMFLIIGLLIITASYGLYAYASYDIVRSDIIDATLTSWIIIPGIILILFLILAIISIIMMQRGKKWQPVYIVAMVIYLVSVALYYPNIPEPLKDLIVFTYLCFIVATVCVFIGHAQVKKKLAQEGKKDVN